MSEDHTLSYELNAQVRKVWDLEVAFNKASERIEELEGIGAIVRSRGEEIVALQRECTQREQAQKKAEEERDRYKRLNEMCTQREQAQKKAEEERDRYKRLNEIHHANWRQAVSEAKTKSNELVQAYIRIRQLETAVTTPTPEEVTQLQQMLKSAESDRNYYRSQWEQAQTKLGQIKRIV